MKFFSIASWLRVAPRVELADAEQKARLFRDPLSHPALGGMSERELADLPFARGPARRQCGT